MRPLHGPDDMECGRLGGWLVDRRLEALGHRFDEGFDGGGFDEGDRCACKPGTGHAGAEAPLEWIVSMHKAHRALLHGGRRVRIDVEDGAVSAFVVVAPDQDEAIVSLSQIATSRGLPVGPIRISRLDLDRAYWLEQLALDGRRLGMAKQQLAWLEGVEISG